MSRGSSLVSLCKKDLIDIYNHAIEAVKPDNLIKSAITFSDDKLTVKDRINGRDIDFNIARSNIHLIGGGKSVLSMACGIAQLAKQAGVDHRFSVGNLSLPMGLEQTLNDKLAISNQLNSINVKCLFGSRDNLPDSNSVQASKSILEGVKVACDNDRESSRQPLFIVLISGGGSACLTSPKFTDLEEKLQLTKFLVQKGANIVELNKVRRYFSSIKGGELARHILESHPNSRILTLILSDVIGDPVEYIASGPTYICSEETSDHKHSMLSILKKYGYPEDRLLLFSGENLSQPNSKEPSKSDCERVFNVVIGNNTIALQAAIERAQKLDYKVELISNKLEGFSHNVVEQICESGKQAFSRFAGGKVLVIGGGEVTINKLENESWGKGGRAQEMAIDYMISRLFSRKNKGTSTSIEPVDMFLAGGTDGQDGPTDVAACLASVADLELESNENEPQISLERLLEAKRRHDSYNLWTQYKPNWLVKTGLTGTNVMDLYLYLLRSEF